MSRGVLIAFEGTDRSGKTTQTKRLASFLSESGKKVAKESPCRFPDRTTEIGKLIDAHLKNQANFDDRTLHLLFSANRWEKSVHIRQALHNGESVIVDRYAFSGVAYSVSKGLPLEWCKSPDVGLPAPDIVIYLDLSVETARERGDYGSERFENVKMQKSVAETFAKLKEDNWYKVNADADEDTVFSRILEAVCHAIDEVPLRKEIKSLWVQ